MAVSYLITTEQDISREENDPAGITVTGIPAAIDMTVYTTVTFIVTSRSGKDIISKSVGDGVTINGQGLDIQLTTADMTNQPKNGNKWKIRVSNGTVPITIGKGAFKILT